jgi:hypothetical protein
MKKTFAVTLAVLCLAAAGCSTVGDGAKSLANSMGAYDYPVLYKPNKKVTDSESWRAVFEVKPAAMPVVERAVDLARKYSRPGQEEVNEFLALAKLDLNHDRVITMSEVNEGSGTLIGEVVDALGEDLRIDGEEKPQPPTPATAKH